MKNNQHFISETGRIKTTMVGQRDSQHLFTQHKHDNHYKLLVINDKT